VLEKSTEAVKVCVSPPPPPPLASNVTLSMNAVLSPPLGFRPWKVTTWLPEATVNALVVRR
jgi:hypothetical protein